jgi:hypothetical protein
VTVSAAAGGQSISFPITVARTNPNPDPGTDPGTELGGLEIVRGQGQVVSVNTPTTTPLTVRFRDPSGRPVPGVSVDWRVAQGGGSVSSVNSTTDENGIATALFSNGLVQLGIPYAQSTVSASTGTQTVNFLVTTIPNTINNNRAEATYFLRNPISRSIVARAGETVPAPSRSR